MMDDDDTAKETATQTGRAAHAGTGPDVHGDMTTTHADEADALLAQRKKPLSGGDEPAHPGKYYAPHTDILETGEAVVLVMEMPGVEKDDLDVHLDGEVLSVEGRVDLSKYESLRPVYTEYNVGSFARTFRVPKTVDPERITATLADGVLTLELAKADHARARRIPVE